MTRNSDDYDEKYMKMEFNLDDELPLNKMIKIPSMATVVGAVFHKNNKYYPKVFLTSIHYDSLDHELLLVVLKKFDFGNYFIDWIKILFINQESCVINGDSTTSYFKLEKGACPGDLISAYLFIIALEIISAMIKSNPNIKDLNIFNKNYLYTANADDKTFFLNNQKSIRELMKTFKLFSKVSSLKPNILRCEVEDIGFLKEVKMTVCGI